MPIKITETQFEALVKTTEAPKPIGLDSSASDGDILLVNPASFDHDWSLEVSLDTTWQTDVTRSINHHTDRWILSARPVRRIRVRYVGATKEEANAIMASVAGSTQQFGFPVPLYPDAVHVDSIANASFNFAYGAISMFVYGDFSRRRFYREGRVAFFRTRSPDQNPHQQRNDRVTYAIVIEVAPSYLHVVFNQDPGALSIDLAEPGCQVIPCIDVEMVESAATTALTDSVLTAELEFVEVEGASALPASWPAISATDSSCLAPFCEILEDMAVFPFDPNWADGVDITAKRPIESNRLGRTQVQDPNGLSYLQFDLTVMGYDRKSSWNVVRFFDAMRGRAGHFLLEHPMRPWRLLSTGKTVGGASFKGGGNHESWKLMARKVVVTLQDGTRHMRDVSNIEQRVGSIDVEWADPLPNANITDMQPIYVCTFGSDTLNEGWATNTVLPSLRLSMVEDPTGGAPVSQGSQLGVLVPLTGYAQIADCNMLLRAGSGCFDASGKPCEAWPSFRCGVSKWHDTSQPAAKPGSFSGIRKVVDNVNPSSTLVTPTVAFRNNGQPSILNTDLRFGFMTDSVTPAGDRHLWDLDEGWTVCVCFTPGQWETTPVERPIFSILSNSFSVEAHFDFAGAPTGANPARGRVRFSTFGGPWSDLPLTVPLGDRFTAVVLTIRLSGNANGRTVHVWVNGEEASAVGTHPFIVEPTSYTQSRWMHGFNFSLGVQNENNGAGLATLVNSWGLWPMINLIASYKRGLDQSELNQLHQLTSKMFLTNVSQSAIY